jgi:membrane protease YdiL (CAAX protease family)
MLKRPLTPLRSILLFVLITFVLSAILEGIIASQGTLDASGGMYTLLLMWSPAAAALLVRQIGRMPEPVISRRLGSAGCLALGYLLPIGYGLVAYAAIWLTGIAPFQNKLTPQLIGFVLVGSVGGIFSSLGEEIGWRGFLVPQLSRITGFVPTALISGAIWAVWHYPILLTTDYNHGTPGLYSLGMFTILVLGLSFIFTWLRLRSNSIWPAVLLHTSHNVFILHFFAPLTADTPLAPYFTGETGAALMVTSVLLAILFWRLSRKIPAPQPVPQPLSL